MLGDQLTLCEFELSAVPIHGMSFYFLDETVYESSIDPVTDWNEFLHETLFKRENNEVWHRLK